MKKKRFKRDFDYWIDEYMYNCRSRKLRPKTMIRYEQTLRLFERWHLEEVEITEPGQVLETTIRHYICSLQERGKYTFYATEDCAITNPLNPGLSGIWDGQAYSPHALRNNFAKRCLMNGMDNYTLSRILGHSSVSVIENAYLDLTDRDLRHRYQNFSPIENMRT